MNADNSINQNRSKANTPNTPWRGRRPGQKKTGRINRFFDFLKGPIPLTAFKREEKIDE